MKASKSLYIPVRGLRYHVRSWGPEDAPRLVMLHGWMDTSASFQFTVDALTKDWNVLAPDWRGYGDTQWAGTDTYWYQEFLADLEHILDQLEPERPVNLIAHSFGATVGMVYAGVRPHRIARAFSVDGFGARDLKPESAPDRYAQLLKRIGEGPRLNDYATYDEFANRLHRQFPTVPPDRIAFLARQWGRVNAHGRIEVINDPAHAKNFGPHNSNRLDDSMACWRAITAPVFFLIASKGSPVKRTADLSDGRLEQRLACFRMLETAWIEDTGHMVHLERPAELAAHVERFFSNTHPTTAI